MSQFIPLEDFVVLKELEAKEKTDSGIILPDNLDKERNQGRVISKGEKVTKPIGVGDFVLFRSYGFDEVEIEKEKYLVGKEEHIIGKLFVA
jgi:chaperonin GroES